LASASLGVPLEARGAKLRKALTGLGFEVPVESDGTVAVFGEASALSGVEVVSNSAINWGTQAAAGHVIEVFVDSASVQRVFNADATANAVIVDGVVQFGRAVLGNASAAAELRVPVEILCAVLRRADAVADFLVPVVANVACVRFAEAAAL